MGINLESSQYADASVPLHYYYNNVIYPIQKSEAIMMGFWKAFGLEVCRSNIDDNNGKIN